MLVTLRNTSIGAKIGRNRTVKMSKIKWFHWITPPPHRPRSNKTATTFTLLLCIILSGDVQLNPRPSPEDIEISTANSFDPVRFNSLIDKTNTNDTYQNCDLTFGPNSQNASTPELRKNTKCKTLIATLINTNSVKSITKNNQIKNRHPVK